MGHGLVRSKKETMCIHNHKDTVTRSGDVGVHTSTRGSARSSGASIRGGAASTDVLAPINFINSRVDGGGAKVGGASVVVIAVLRNNVLSAAGLASTLANSTPIVVRAVKSQRGGHLEICAVKYKIINWLQLRIRE